MARKRNHQPRIHQQRLSVALPSFLLLGLMEHAGISKPPVTPQPLLFLVWQDWMRKAKDKLKGIFS